MKSNIEHWKAMQEQGYFEKHPCYDGLSQTYAAETQLIDRFFLLTKDMNVVVIGCGFGRESAHIGPLVKNIYGIDVSNLVLDKAVTYLKSAGVDNFIPILAENYKSGIPDSIDLVFSLTVMQHITRDLAKDYFSELGSRLSKNGEILVQFLEDFSVNPQTDAKLEVYEPSVSWTSREIADLVVQSDLKLIEFWSYLVTPTALWHWVRAKR